MIKQRESSDSGEIYVIYSDLFLLLFLMAILMMGSNPLSLESAKAATTGQQDNTRVLHLYVDQKGEVFLKHKKALFQLLAQDTHELLQQQGKKVVLHIPKNLSMQQFQRLQQQLNNAGAESVHYKIGEGFNEKAS